MRTPVRAVRRATLIPAAAILLAAADCAAARSIDAVADDGLVPEPLSLSGSARSRPPDRRENNGEDETRPLTRVDFRTRFENLSARRDEWTFTLRADTPFPLGNGWEFATRLDAPVDLTNKTSSDNPVGDYQGGLGDFFFQGLLVDQVDDRNALAVGTRIIFPTGTQDQFGQGKWQLVPTLAYRYFLDDTGTGSFVAGVARYQFDFAGDDDRSHVSRLLLGPIINLQLPEHWYVTFWSSADITYDFRTHDWFVPIDVTVGKKLSPSVVTSFEVEVPVIRDLDLYRFKVEFRVGFFF